MLTCAYFSECHKLSFTSILAMKPFPPSVCPALTHSSFITVVVDFMLICFLPYLMLAPLLSLTLSFPSSLRQRQSKDVSVIKAAGANGGISSHADSLHHRTDRGIPHTNVGAPTCKHTYTLADM